MRARATNLARYENVQPALAEALLEPVFKVWVFIGAQQTKVKIDLLDLVQRKGDDAGAIRIGSTGRNALDFHMAYYLGELAAKDGACYLHVISKDTGLVPLITHLRERGIEAARWEDVFGIPIAKPPSALPEEDKLSLIIEYLVRRGKQRPGSLKTLVRRQLCSSRDSTIRRCTHCWSNYDSRACSNWTATK